MSEFNGIGEGEYHRLHIDPPPPDAELDAPPIGLWRVSTGDLLPIKDMTESHLSNALTFLDRRGLSSSSKAIELAQELGHRVGRSSARRSIRVEIVSGPGNLFGVYIGDTLICGTVANHLMLRRLDVAYFTLLKVERALRRARDLLEAVLKSDPSAWGAS